MRRSLAQGCRVKSFNASLKASTCCCSKARATGLQLGENSDGGRSRLLVSERSRNLVRDWLCAWVEVLIGCRSSLHQCLNSDWSARLGVTP